MAILNFCAPILPGKLDQWKAFADQLSVGGAKRSEWEASMKMNGVTRQVVSLQQTPHGEFVNVFLEAATPDGIMAAMGKSSSDYDKWFAAQVLEIHGNDVTQPPPGPMAEVKLDYCA